MSKYRVAYIGESRYLSHQEWDVESTSAHAAVLQVFETITDEPYKITDDGSLFDCEGVLICAAGSATVEMHNGCLYAELQPLYPDNNI